MDATGYTVNATSINGHQVSCSSATAGCTLTDLMCSETYAATITAKGDYCDSAPSPRTNITTCECTNSSVSSACNLSLFIWSIAVCVLFPLQRPALHPSLLNTTRVATTQRWSGGLIPWDVSISWRT